MERTNEFKEILLDENDDKNEARSKWIAFFPIQFVIRGKKMILKMNERKHTLTISMKKYEWKS